MAVDELAYQHLPDRAYEAIESFYSLFQALVYFVPQLLFATIAGVALQELWRPHSAIDTRTDDEASVGA